MTYGNIFTISLYRVIGRIGMVNEGSDMGGKTWDRVRDMSVQIRCPHDSGVGICTRLCVYVFGIIQIVIYDMGRCHMSVVIDPGEVNCFCGCVMKFMMFLVYFRDNNQDIITTLYIERGREAEQGSEGPREAVV